MCYDGNESTGATFAPGNKEVLDPLEGPCRLVALVSLFFFFSSRRRHTRCSRDWSSDVCSSDLPAISIRMSGFAISDCATMSSTVLDSGFSADFPVSKVTPRRITGVRSGVNRIGQPAASTLVPGAVPGHLSLVSSTPSPSESLKRWQPTLSTSVPGGVLGHLSMPSGTPSPSESRGQPFASTVAPGGVLGHWSIPSATPSASESTGHPFASTWAPGGVLPHWSIPSGTPSPSESSAQPLLSTVAPAGVLGHWSRPSYTPSWSASDGQPRGSTVAPRGVLGQASRLSGTPSWSKSGGGPPPMKSERPSELTTWPAQSPLANSVLGA